MDETTGILGRLAHYRILNKLGAGGMGEVYRARDEQLDRDVAVKVLPASSFDDPAARARLVREARAAAALNHPNICAVYEVGEAHGQANIAMEQVEGRTLGARLAAGASPPDQIVHFGRQLADALAHAHDRGVVHRDLKSGNVIVTPDGHVKVLDFGLAKRSTPTDLTQAVTELNVSLAQPGTAVGTLPYMAPEQLRGHNAQMPSDVWALGVVLYEMATGTLPFGGQTSFELSAAILNSAPAPLPHSVPPTVRTAIEGCLEKDPSLRFQNGGDVRTALAGVRAGTPVSHAATRTGHSRAAPAAEGVARLTRRGAIRLAGAAIIVTASGVTAWRLWPAGVAARSLAVLPFENRLKDEDLEYLCDGVAESLIHQMSRLRSLRVTNLSTVLNFKGQPVDPRTAGSQLGVETVLAGSIERQSARLLISSRLVDVATGRELWTNTYDRDASDLLDVQDEIATAILSGVGARGDLLACGDKFLVISRGTRYQRAAIARQPANILVYANTASALPKALERADVDATLRKAGYKPTSVSDPIELEQALRQGGWDIVVADLADGMAVSGRLQGASAPMVLPVAYNATGSDIAQAKKDYQRVLKGPVKSQAFLEAIDDALALREKLRPKAKAA